MTIEGSSGGGAGGGGGVLRLATAPAEHILFLPCGTQYLDQRPAEAGRYRAAAPPLARQTLKCALGVRVGRRRLRARRRLPPRCAPMPPHGSTRARCPCEAPTRRVASSVSPRCRQRIRKSPRPGAAPTSPRSTRRRRAGRWRRRRVLGAARPWCHNTCCSDAAPLVAVLERTDVETLVEPAFEAQIFAELAASRVTLLTVAHRPPSATCRHSRAPPRRRRSASSMSIVCGRWGSGEGAQGLACGGGGDRRGDLLLIAGRVEDLVPRGSAARRDRCS